MHEEECDMETSPADPANPYGGQGAMRTETVRAEGEEEEGEGGEEGDGWKEEEGGGRGEMAVGGEGRGGEAVGETAGTDKLR